MWDLLVVGVGVVAVAAWWYRIGFAEGRVSALRDMCARTEALDSLEARR